ncbi:divergent polysaccharide deacetylase family protein, partial [Albidovulum sp.]
APGAAGEAAPEAPGPGAAPADDRAVALYAAPFDNDAGAPMIGLVLFEGDAGAAGPDLLAPLAAEGAHVTIAIDPASPGAAERARAYRLAGHEIAVLAPDLPAGIAPRDREVAYLGSISVLPDSVAMIGTPAAAFQQDRRVAQHLVALLGADGRGLISYDRGLNPARQAAEGAGLPHATIYRDLDANGENAATVARYLDRAAFEAARSGQTLVVGHLRPETVQALAGWLKSGARGTVIAPASALMLARPAG